MKGVKSLIYGQERINQRKRKNVKPLVFQIIVFISSDMGKQSLNDGQGIWI